MEILNNDLKSPAHTGWGFYLNKNKAYMNELQQLKQRVSDLERSLQRELWMDSQDMHDMLHISIRTLAHWRSSGLLPYYSIAKKVWYKRSEVEAMLESGRVNKSKLLKIKTA